MKKKTDRFPMITFIKATLAVILVGSTSQGVSDSLYIASSFSALIVTQGGVIGAWIEADYCLLYI
ncbi:hypothetical protein [Vibrio sp.]|uniref:hypothetical protein n=1 Tax=Vibrio sp. TaxID=678 RepID=UPI003AA9144C